MATLQELFDLRNLSELRNRTAAASWNAAKGIFIEAPTTPNHTERLVWSVKILRDHGEGAAVLEVFKAVIVLLQDTGEAATDVQIETAVGQVINHFATAGV